MEQRRWDGQDVERFIIALAKAKGFRVRGARGRTGDVEIDGIVDRYGIFAQLETDALYRHGRRIAFIHTLAFVVPNGEYDAETLFWTALHEFGHFLQWQDFGDDFEAIAIEDRYAVEADAWSRAEYFAATEIGIYLSKRMQAFKDSCLKSYEWRRK